jgi:hypothetical protein
MALINVIGFQVPALTDNDIWFANAAAWSNYWNNVTFSINVPIADTVNAGLVKAAATAVYADTGVTATKRYTLQVDLDGTGNLQNVPVPDAGSFDELKIQVEALVLAVQNMRTAMKTAGLITNAQ